MPESNTGVDKKSTHRYSLSFDAAAFFGSEYAETLSRLDQTRVNVIVA
jgi:hypothetical protein